MAGLAEQITRSPSLTGLTGPVVDATGLAGGYDFELQYAPTALSATNGGQTFAQPLANLGLKLEPRDVPLPTITVERVMMIEEAIDRQMGLKLRARQRPGRVLVVDYVEDSPSPLK
jgi:hypothetical protein